MKKLILSVFFALAVLTGFSASEVSASVITDDQTSTQTSTVTYIYVKQYENGKWVTYVYTTDGMFVNKIEDAN